MAALLSLIVTAFAGVEDITDSKMPVLRSAKMYRAAVAAPLWCTHGLLSPAPRPTAWTDGVWVRWGANRSPDADWWFSMTRYSRFVM